VARAASTRPASAHPADSTSIHSTFSSPPLPRRLIRHPIVSPIPLMRTLTGIPTFETIVKHPLALLSFHKPIAVTHTSHQRASPSHLPCVYSRILSQQGIQPVYQPGRVERRMFAPRTLVVSCFTWHHSQRTCFNDSHSQGPSGTNRPLSPLHSPVLSFPFCTQAEWMLKNNMAWPNLNRWITLPYQSELSPSQRKRIHIMATSDKLWSRAFERNGIRKRQGDRRVQEGQRKE
jgi:hypothetical protein